MSIKALMELLWVLLVLPTRTPAHDIDSVVKPRRADNDEASLDDDGDCRRHHQ